MERATASA